MKSLSPDRSFMIACARRRSSDWHRSGVFPTRGSTKPVEGFGSPAPPGADGRRRRLDGDHVAHGFRSYPRAKGQESSCGSRFLERPA